MPNRILRDGILTSERIAKLGWAEETFYRRLMSVVDDFGCYYANPTLLRAACYPLQLDKVSDADIGKWLACVQKAALVSVYPAPDGKRYLKLLDFRQQVRAVRSKFPQPPPDAEQQIADAQHMHSKCEPDAEQQIADAHLDVDVDVDVKETEAKASVVASIADDRLACPHQRIIDAWTEVLPELPTVRQWSATRARHLQARWREQCRAKGWTSADDGVAWFRKLFGHIRKSPFLMGQSPRGEGHEAWTCSLPWVIEAENFAKLLEGNYHREAA